MDQTLKYFGINMTAVILFALVMAVSIYAIVSLNNPCPTPQTTTITVEEIPINVEMVEAAREIKKPFKWIDSENQTIHYIYPDGSGRAIPMYATVPPLWYENMLEAYMNLHGESIPPEIADSIPWEWKHSVMPGVNGLPEGGDTN